MYTFLLINYYSLIINVYWDDRPIENIIHKITMLCYKYLIKILNIENFDIKHGMLNNTTQR